MLDRPNIENPAQHIGLTYDLRDDYEGQGYSEEALSEFDSIETIEAIERALWRHGYTTERIGHVRNLAKKLVAGQRWRMVFNIAEGLSGRSREAQVPCLLEAYDIPYVFSDPLTQAVALDKSIAKRLVRDSGIPTPRFQVIENIEDILKCDLAYPIFVKPIGEGTGKGCSNASKITDQDQFIHVATSLIFRFNQPVLAEEYLPGREFTVGILGNGNNARVIGVMEILLGENAEENAYSYENKANYLERVTYKLADDVEAMQAASNALAAYHALGCLDASRLDLRSDAHGVPNFIEANTLAGLNPIHSDLPILASKAGMSYETLILEIIKAAHARHGITGHVHGMF